MVFPKSLTAPKRGEEILVADAGAFPPEGEEAHARLVCDAYALGWRRFICFGHRGQRFLGAGLGPATGGVRIDAYGSTAITSAPAWTAPSSTCTGTARTRSARS